MPRTSCTTFSKAAHLSRPLALRRRQRTPTRQLHCARYHPHTPTLALMSMATHEPDEGLCTALLCQHNRASTFTASCKALMGTGRATMEDPCFSCQVRAGSATFYLCCIITDDTPTVSHRSGHYHVCVWHQVCPWPSRGHDHLPS